MIQIVSLGTRAPLIPAAHMQHLFFVQDEGKCNQCNDSGNELIIIHRDAGIYDGLQYKITDKKQNSLVRFHVRLSSLHAVEMVIKL